MFILSSTQTLSQTIVDTIVGKRATGYLGTGNNPIYSQEVFDTDDLPDTFDWRNSDAVTSTKNQGNCGSCVSFAATKAFEGSLIVQKGLNHLDLAEQEMLSCRRGDAMGCNGAYLTAPAYMAVHGQGIESDFPYVARAVKCKNIPVNQKAISYKLLGSSNVRPSKEMIKAALVKYGPLVVTVKAGGSGWSGRTGKITSCIKTKRTNHAVTLIGYDKTGWIFRNSWGSGWGDNGDSWIGFNCDGFASEVGHYIVD